MHARHYLVLSNLCSLVNSPAAERTRGRSEGSTFSQLLVVEEPPAELPTFLLLRSCRQRQQLALTSSVVNVISPLHSNSCVFPSLKVKSKCEQVRLKIRTAKSPSICSYLFIPRQGNNIFQLSDFYSIFMCYLLLWI